MANEEKKVTVNEQEAKVEETKKEETPKTEQPAEKQEKKDEKVVIEVNPKVAKVLGVTKKVLKYAVPVGIAAGSVFLGIKIGASKESKRSGAIQSDLNNQISDLQAKLEAKPDVVPMLPDNSTSILDNIPMDVVE